MGTWSVTDARAWARERLTTAGIDSVDADVRELLEWACDASSQWDLPAELNEDQAEKLRSAVGERALRIPLQHVTSRMFFRGLTLAARPGVFVVRPETEVLAGLAIDEAMSVVSRRGEARVVDLCAGSGAIGLAVAVETTRTEVWAVEKEAEPFALACQNRDAVGVPCLHLERGDATDPATLAHLDGMVDVVVTNPPYVPADEMPTQPEASADPHVALYGGSPDGTEIPARIARRALTLLRPGGVLLMEHSPTQEEAIAAIAAQLGMTDIATLPDLAGRRAFPERPRTRIDKAHGIRDTMNTMSTETILSAVPSMNEADLARAQRELRDGHLLVVPTDTVYGIGADAANPEAVAAVLAAKGRGRQMPPPVLVASVEAIDSLCVDVPEAARACARAFWPGGLTLILRARPDLGWDLGETGGTIGVRMPNQSALLRLLHDFGPMAVTSANLTGQPPADLGRAGRRILRNTRVRLPRRWPHPGIHGLVDR